MMEEKHLGVPHEPRDWLYKINKKKTSLSLYTQFIIIMQASTVQCVTSLAWLCASGQGGEGEREEERAAETKGGLMADRLSTLKTQYSN